MEEEDETHPPTHSRPSPARRPYSPPSVTLALPKAKAGPTRWPFSAATSAVPVGNTPFPHLQTPPHLRQPQQIRQHNHLPSPVLKRHEEDSGERKRKRKRGWVRELTAAVVKLGEAYEAAESAKLKQMVEMEKQRMKFAKDLELQRIKFIINTQLQISNLCCGNDDSGGKEINHHHHHHGNHVDHDHANSDSSK